MMALLNQVKLDEVGTRALCCCGLVSVVLVLMLQQSVSGSVLGHGLVGVIGDVINNGAIQEVVKMGCKGRLDTSDLYKFSLVQFLGRALAGFGDLASSSSFSDVG